MLVIALAVLLAVLLGFGAWGYRNRQSAGPAARALRPVLAGPRRARWPAAPWWPARSRRRFGGARRELAALADAAERAPRQAREALREQAVGRAGDGRSGIGAGGADRRAGRRRSAGAAGPPIPQRRGPRHAGAARADAWFGCCAWLEQPRCQAISRSPSGRRRCGTAIILRPTGAPRRGWCCSTKPARCCCCAGLTPQRPTGLNPAPRWWFTVGGQAGDGESLAEAAARELAEETGLRVDPADMIGPIWRRDAVFDFNGSAIDSEEFFFVYRTRAVRAVHRRADRAGEPLHPLPPLV